MEQQTKMSPGYNGKTGVSVIILTLAIAVALYSMLTKNESLKIATKTESDSLRKGIAEDIKQDVPKLLSEQNLKNPEYADYNSLTDMKQIPLAKNFESWTPNSSIANNKELSRKICIKGSLASGYLYMKLSKNNKQLTSWESVYLKINNVGGHLFRPKSLPVPPSDKTELLFRIDDIPYLPGKPYNENASPQSANFLDMLKDGCSFRIVCFISSLKKASIEEMSIYYDCEEGSECSVEVR